MIAATNNGTQVESTLTTDQKVDMGIDPGAFAHIMSILTDLYSNRTQAVIREYSTNAWDAHREAGINKPIEVTLPTRFNPELAIRDFGVGLSVQDIHDIYSQYGASTKRGTNDQVGMLGLGCKSALTYTTQFTVTSVREGTKVQVIVARDEDGTGSMHIADTSATDEPNGTTIKVPVMAGDIQRFQDEAGEFFSYWPKGHVLIDGKAPKRVVENAMHVCDNIYVVEGGRYSDAKHKVVMGNVAYPAPNLNVSIPSGYSILAFVPIGSVNFAPSREALMDTATTTRTLKGIADEYAKGIVGVVEREVKAAPTHNEALSVRYKWREFIASGSLITYKGEAIPDTLEHPACIAQGTQWPNFKNGYPTPTDRPYEIGSRYYKTKTESRWRVESHTWNQYLWIHGWDYAKLSRTQAAKIEKYIADNNLRGANQHGHPVTPTAVLHPIKFPHAKWLRPDLVVDWKVIEAVVLPKAANGMTFAGQRKTGSFDCYVDGAWKSEVDANDIDTKNLVAYYAGPQGHGHCRQYSQVLKALGKPYTIVTMPMNRRDKFLRDFPKAVKVADAVHAAYDAWVKALTKDQQAALAMNAAGMVETFRAIQPSLVNDPDVQEAIRIAKINLTKLLEQRKVFEHALPWGTVKDGGKFNNPLAKYPLYTTSGMRTNPTHVYWYINAAFAANI